MYQKQNKAKFLMNVIHHHMEDTLHEIEQPIKLSNQAFIGLLYLETVLNGLKIVINVREWET